MDYRRIGDWTTLVGANVEIRLHGSPACSGQVDAVTNDGTILWLQAPAEREGRVLRGLGHGGPCGIPLSRYGSSRIRLSKKNLRRTENMTGVVVVGVDGSPTARKAAESARRIALALGATLHVVSAFGSDRGEVVGSGSDQLVVSDASKAEDVARRIAVELAGAPLEVIPFAIQGSPAQALVKQAETHNARMIVVGSKGMRGLGRVLGSIASGVAHHAPCDVYVVKTDQA